MAPAAEIAAEEETRKQTLTRPGGVRRGVWTNDVVPLVLTIAGLLVVTSLPYAFAYASAPPDKQFMGILLDVPDEAQYLSWARESTHALLIGNKQTPEPGAPAYFNLFWLIIGRLAAALGLGLAETAQVVRPIVGAFFLGAIYWFVGLVTANRVQRWVAFVVAAVGGGLGWISVLQKQFGTEMKFPLDLYANEPNTLLTVMAFPHQAIATGLLVAILGLAALAFERDSLRVALAAGLLALVLGVQHGYDLVVVYAVVGSTASCVALRSGRWVRVCLLTAAVCACSGPIAVYLLYLTSQSPIWRGVLAQYGNAGVFTPRPDHLLVLMGVPLLLVVVGLPWLLRSSLRAVGAKFARVSARELLLASWLGVGFVLLYIPTDFQIKMLAGWQIPVAIIATRTLFGQLMPLLRRWRGTATWPLRPELLLAAILVLSVLPANVYLYAWRFVDLKRADYPYYLNRDDLAAMRWLETHSDPSEVVLSSLTIGAYIPSTSGNTAFLAHWAQTLDFFNKRRIVAQFFNDKLTDHERLEVLTQYNVHYVFYGAEERVLGSFDPDRSAFLEKVFSTPSVSLYRTQNTVGSAPVGTNEVG